jgi:hypothetical protein
MATFTASPIVEAPASDDTTLRETLAHLEAHDSVSNADYAFVAFKETHRATGAWCIRIHSEPALGALFHPNAIRIQARAAGIQGRPWFTWGKSLSPRLGDPRKIEYRIHVRNGDAVALEIYVRLRKFDHTADEPRTVLIPWPSS